MNHLKNAKTVVSRGSEGGALVRALASHQCGHGSDLSVDAICGLSLLLVLSLAPRGFSLSTPVFPSPHTPTFPNSNSTWNQVDEEPPCGCPTSNSLLFIYLNVNKLETSSLFSFLYTKSSALIGSINVQCLGKVIRGLVNYSIWHYRNNQMEIVFKLW